MHDVIILGSGPAGLTAALYLARAKLHPLVIEGPEPGGQLVLTTTVENFPGFPEGILGGELMDAMRHQADRFGATFRQESATAVDLTTQPMRVTTSTGDLRCRSLIVATGASAKRLGLESERALLGRGVSTCATCDGFFFRDKRVVVVGGGDSALEEGLFLTRFASSVTIVHRRDQLRASKVLQDRARANSKISYAWNSVVREILDVKQNRVTRVVVQDVRTSAERVLECEGVFIAIGHQPNTLLFQGQLAMTNGYIDVQGKTRTSVPGVFAAGDVQDYVYRQAITAAGSGCMAALDCEKWLESLA
jgi:thioredoxin reductase (NADPH)